MKFTFSILITGTDIDGLALILGMLHETERGPLTVVAGLGGGLSFGDPGGKPKGSNLDIFKNQIITLMKIRLTKLNWLWNTRVDPA